mgnify:CR=1 FL=1
MKTFSLATAAPQNNLRRLLIIRGLFLLATCITLALCYWQQNLLLPYRNMLWIVSALTIINLVMMVQLRFTTNTSQRVCFSQLLIDILGLTLLLFFSGGADNPFVSYYLVPLCIAAATLSWRLTWPLVATSLILYTALFFINIPLPEIAPHHNHGSADAPSISTHTIGMWINFLVSALLITFFVTRMASSLRQQDQDIVQLREDQLRDQQLMAVATLAAGTAHDLATPLTTIKALLSEMQVDYAEPQQLVDDLTLLTHQVSHCTTTLQQLNQQASELKDGVLPLLTIRKNCKKVVDNWLLLRPEVMAEINIDQDSPELEVRWQPTIAQSMSNLLNNAADANPIDIQVDIRWDINDLRFTIHDRGPGIDPEVAQNLGKAFVTDKGVGRGLGLFLTQAAISRYKGTVSLERHASGGTLTTLIIPLEDAQPVAANHE